ncbi:MAG TPA: methyltransferase domain-containing protein [Pseudonocardiaceae bacterium]|jgi:SAM-dependent methyltransferase
MTAVMQFDEDLSLRLEATYITADVVEQRRVVLDLLDPRPGEDALDIGSGPGYLACEIAERVGPTGSVHGIEPSESMLAIAGRRQLGPQAATVKFSAGEATGLPFPDASFDLVTATQVYEYVPDIPAALTEAYRVLRRGGRLLILDTDWDSIVWHSSDPERMRRVLTAWDEHLAEPHLPRRLRRLLTGAGFTVTQRRVLPMFNTGYDPGSFSAGVIGFVAGFVPGRAGVTDGETEAWRTDLVDMGEDYFFSLNRYLFLAGT